jgi:hypothetical protein
VMGNRCRAFDTTPSLPGVQPPSPAPRSCGISEQVAGRRLTHLGSYRLSESCSERSRLRAERRTSVSTSPSTRGHDARGVPVLGALNELRLSRP